VFVGSVRGAVPPGVDGSGGKFEPADEPVAGRRRSHAGGHREGEHVQRVAPREVRQPEVARLLSLLLAALVAVPVVQAALTLGLAAAFVIEYVAGGAQRPLSALTSPPRVEPLAVPGATVRRWTPPG